MRGLPKVDQFKELVEKNDSFYEEIKHENSQQSLHRLLDNLEVDNDEMQEKVNSITLDLTVFEELNDDQEIVLLLELD